MTAYSAFMTVLTVLGIWTAVSLIATPIVVSCLCWQSELNAQFARQLRREAWLTATQRA